MIQESKSTIEKVHHVLILGHGTTSNEEHTVDTKDKVTFYAPIGYTLGNGVLKGFVNTHSIELEDIDNAGNVIRDSAQSYPLRCKLNTREHYATREDASMPFLVANQVKAAQEYFTKYFKGADTTLCIVGGKQEGRMPLSKILSLLSKHFKQEEVMCTGQSVVLI